MPNRVWTPEAKSVKSTGDTEHPGGCQYVEPSNWTVNNTARVTRSVLIGNCKNQFLNLLAMNKQVMTGVSTMSPKVSCLSLTCQCVRIVGGVALLVHSLGWGIELGCPMSPERPWGLDYDNQQLLLQLGRAALQPENVGIPLESLPPLGETVSLPVTPPPEEKHLLVGYPQSSTNRKGARGDPTKAAMRIATAVDAYGVWQFHVTCLVFFDEGLTRVTCVLIFQSIIKPDWEAKSHR